MSVSGSIVSPTIRVRFFARYAELLGAELIDLPSADIATVADLLARIRLLPGGDSLGHALVAVNLKQVRLEAPIRPGDEVALLPPMAGG